MLVFNLDVLRANMSKNGFICACSASFRTHSSGNWFDKPGQMLFQQIYCDRMGKSGTGVSNDIYTKV